MFRVVGMTANGGRLCLRRQETEKDLK